MSSQTYRLLGLLALLPVLVGLAGPAVAAEVSAAVAANFTRPAEELGAAFAERTGDRVVFSFGATGALFAQISQGAPFDLLLAADDMRPARAVREGLGVPGSVFTYGFGKLALYGPGRDVSDGAAALRADDIRYLAIAEPRTAPYGAAALETLAALGLAEALAPRVVTGENISQTLQFVDSGNAELGFVALSQVIDKPATEVWRVPEEFYRPIAQDAVLLAPGADKPAAQAFLEFLKSAEAKAIIASYGYGTE